MMRLFSRLLAFIGLAGSAQAGPDYLSPKEFAAAARVGQIYSCLSEDGAHALALKIGAIEELQNVGQVYHVQIIGIEPPDLPPLGHVTLSAISFSRCLLDPEIERLLDAPFDDAGFKEGLEIWRKNSGGVFTVDVTEIYEIAMQMLQKQGDD